MAREPLDFQQLVDELLDEDPMIDAAFAADVATVMLASDPAEAEFLGQ